MTYALLVVTMAILIGSVELKWYFDRRGEKRERIAALARIEAQDARWRREHPELVAQGCPPPPTVDSMTWRY